MIPVNQAVRLDSGPFFLPVWHAEQEERRCVLGETTMQLIKVLLPRRATLDDNHSGSVPAGNCSVVPRVTPACNNDEYTRRA